MKTCNSKTDTLVESELQRIYKYHIYPNDSKKLTSKVFLIIDDGSQGGPHWVFLIIEDKKPIYFGSFGGQPYKFLLNQLYKKNIS